MDTYNMSKFHERVIPQAGHARAYIFGVWLGLKIWINLILLSKNPILSSFYYFIAQNNWGRSVNISGKSSECTRQIGFLHEAASAFFHMQVILCLKCTVSERETYYGLIKTVVLGLHRSDLDPVKKKVASLTKVKLDLYVLYRENLGTNRTLP